MAGIPSLAYHGSVSSGSVRGCLLGLAVLATTASRPAAAEVDLDREVLAIMARRRLEIRKRCWEDAKVHVDASVRAEFTIAPNGVVTDVIPRDPKGPHEIVGCVVAEVRKTAFPASKKGGWYRWPFLFKGP